MCVRFDEIGHQAVVLDLVSEMINFGRPGATHLSDASERMNASHSAATPAAAGVPSSLGGERVAAAEVGAPPAGRLRARRDALLGMVVSSTYTGRVDGPKLPAQTSTHPPRQGAKMDIPAD